MMKKQSLSQKQINAFLHYGYIPRPRQVNIEGLCKRYNIQLGVDKASRSVGENIAIGSQILDNTFSNIAKQVGDQRVVIPISGGMDSRGILAGMLKYLPKEQIQTVTVGIPGALDYEIGQQVARKAGVANKAVNLDELSWNEDKLIRYAMKYQSPIALIEGFLFSQVFDGFKDNPFYLSGFIGEALTGAHLPTSQSTDWQQAKKTFSKWNNYSRSSAFFPENDLLPPSPLDDVGLLTLDDQLDFFVRQRCYIKPLVLLKGHQHIAPYLNPAWIEFMLNLPHELRKGQLLYKKILQYMYPDLFSLPLKNLEGLPLGASRFQMFQKRVLNEYYNFTYRYLPFVYTKPSLGLNYIDFERAYQEKPDLKSIVEQSLNDLHKRNIVEEIHIPTIWREHQSCKGNHAQLITLLASLEIFFKVAETKANEQHQKV